MYRAPERKARALLHTHTHYVGPQDRGARDRDAGLRVTVFGPWVRRLVASLAVIALLFGLVFSFGATAQAADRNTLEIVTKDGVHVFKVEIADTDAERQKGLMFRKELPEGQGMLFDFKEDLNISMWMRNTFIPLDMLFINADGRIRRIAENTTPLSERTIPAGGPVRGVLEVIGGTAKKLGIRAGDRVAHPIFSGR